MYEAHHRRTGSPRRQRVARTAKCASASQTSLRRKDRGYRQQHSEQGAIETLKRWGKLTVIDDSDLADITLTFDKKSGHESTSSQKTNSDGTPSTSYGVSFGSSITMKATLKSAATSFYTTTTSDSKKKAGASCVLDFQSAYVAGP